MVNPPTWQDIMDNKGRGKVVIVSQDGGPNSNEEPLFVKDVPFYKHITDFSADDITYDGYALPGTALNESGWLIVRQTRTSTTLIDELSNSSPEMNVKWTDRATLTYG